MAELSMPLNFIGKRKQNDRRNKKKKINSNLIPLHSTFPFGFFRNPFFLSPYLKKNFSQNRSVFLFKQIYVCVYTYILLGVTQFCFAHFVKYEIISQVWYLFDH